MLASLLETLNTYQNYKEMGFWRANLADDGCDMLANWVKPNCYLKTLELIDNRISMRGCKSLKKMLQNNECLTTLMLDYNDIGDEGAKELAEGVSWNRTLTVLSLRYCGIGEEGGIAIELVCYFCFLKLITIFRQIPIL